MITFLVDPVADVLMNGMFLVGPAAVVLINGYDSR